MRFQQGNTLNELMSEEQRLVMLFNLSNHAGTAAPSRVTRGQRKNSDTLAPAPCAHPARRKAPQLFGETHRARHATSEIDPVARTAGGRVHP